MKNTRMLRSARARRRDQISFRTAVSLLIAACLLSGCHTYERKPLDLTHLRQAWADRALSQESGHQFAARLAESEGASVVFDPSDGFTLAEAEPFALVFNRQLRVARLEAKVTQATARYAGLWADPVAGLDMERIVTSTSEPWVLAGTIGLTIPISGRLEVEKQRAGARYGAELQRVLAKEWATRAALRELWIEWSAQSHRAEITSDLVARLKGVVEMTSKLAEAGEMSRIDARLFRVEAAGSEAELIASRARVRELELQLRDIMGLAPDAPVTFVETVSFVKRDTRSQDLRTAMESGNVELAAVRDEYEVAEQTLRLEIREQYPDLTIGPGYGTDQGDQRVLLGIRLPLSLWNRNQQGVAEASAGREVARARVESTYEHLSALLAIAETRYEAGLRTREAVETRVLPLADEQNAEVQHVAELGRVDPLLLLQAIKTEYDAKLRLVGARAAESIGAIRVNELLGPPGGPLTNHTDPAAANPETPVSTPIGDEP